MSEDWKKYKFGELAKLRKETIKPEEFREQKYIGLEHIGQGNFLLNGIGSASDANSNKSKFYPGDILYGKIRPYFKKVYQPSFSGICSTDILVINSNDENLITQNYLYQLVKTQEFTDKATETSSGTKMPRADWNSLKKLDYKLPPLPEQRAIASILSALDDKIELNLQMNKTLEDMAMALYKHWFVDFGPFQNGKFVDSELGEIPEGWEVKRLDEIIDFSNGYAFKSKELLKVEEEDCFHIFKMGHILKGGGLKANGTKSWIKKSKCEKLEKYILKVGDILMSMTDMKDNMTILGHTALMNEDQKFIVNQRVGLLRVNNKIGIGYPFVFLLTNSTDFIERLRSQANSGVQVNLSTGAIKSATLVAPTKSINKEFHEMVKPFYERINQNAIENQTLTKTRDTLLPKLISGAVRVKDIEKIIAPMI